MGVPFLYKYISQNVECHTPASSEKPATADVVFIDCNCLIHTCCANADAIMSWLDRLVSKVKPKNVLYISVDGVAPKAKQTEQRNRRFRSVQENRKQDQYYDSRAISPGTEVMDILMKQLRKKLHGWKKWQTFDVIFSDCYTPGEAEHEIFGYIRERNKRDTGGSFIVVGADADLLLLALMHDNVNIVRTQLDLVDVSKIKDFICAQMTGETLKSINKETKNRLIHDFVLLVSILGNDFIPSMEHLSAKNGDVSTITDIYFECIWENGDAENRNYISTPEGDYDGQMLLQYLQKVPRAQSFQPMRDITYIVTDPEQKDGTQESEQRQQILRNYLEGLKFTFKYYTSGVPSWSWYYKFSSTSPRANEFMALERMVEITFDKGSPVTPLVNLMFILPLQSAHLLPRTYQEIVQQEELKHLFQCGTSISPDAKWVVNPLTDEQQKMIQRSAVDSNNSISDEEKERSSNSGHIIVFVSSLDDSDEIKSGLPGDSELISAGGWRSGTRSVPRNRDLKNSQNSPTCRGDRYQNQRVRKHDSSTRNGGFSDTRKYNFSDRTNDYSSNQSGHYDSKRSYSGDGRRFGNRGHSDSRRNLPSRERFGQSTLTARKRYAAPVEESDMFAKWSRDRMSPQNPTV